MVLFCFYLFITTDQQTAILHNSILNVHSPELQKNELNTVTAQVAYRQPQLQANNKNSPQLIGDSVNILNNHNLHNITTDAQDQQQHQRIGKK